MKVVRKTGADLVEQVLSDPDKYLDSGRRDVEDFVQFDVQRRTQLLQVVRAGAARKSREQSRRSRTETLAR